MKKSITITVFAFLLAAPMIGCSESASKPGMNDSKMMKDDKMMMKDEK